MQGQRRSWDTELLLNAAAMGAEGFSKAAEVVAVLAAAQLPSRLTKGHYMLAYKHPFGLKCPGAGGLGEMEVPVPAGELASTSEAARHYTRGFVSGAFKVSVVDSSYLANSYQVFVTLNGLVKARRPIFTKYYRENKILGALYLGKPHHGGQEILLDMGHIVENIDVVLRLSAEDRLDPHGFLDLFVDLARAAGSRSGLEALARVTEVIAMATRAAVHEVERASRVAADARAAPAVSEVSEEIRQAILTAYYRAAESLDSIVAGGQVRGDPKDLKLIEEVMRTYRGLVETARKSGLGIEAVAGHKLDEYISSAVSIATKVRAAAEVLASLSENP